MKHGKYHMTLCGRLRLPTKQEQNIVHTGICYDFTNVNQTKVRQQMDTESQWTFDRMRLYRLWEAHPDWSLRQFAHELSYDVKWVSKWLHRFQTTPLPSVRMFLSESRAPHECPHRISDEVRDVIGELRETLSEKYHRRAGGRTILHDLLKRDWLRRN